MNIKQAQRQVQAIRPSQLPAMLPLAHAALCASLLLGSPAHALDANALPTNGQVAAGSASIRSSGSSMTVTQSSERLVTNWSTFNIGSAASVSFSQPSTSSVALNRVTSSDASQIMGSLTANGQVYLVNPAGVVFGSGAQVSVGGLVASTLNISDANFMAGRNVFELDGATGTVVNQGSIQAADGGYVVLLGAQVTNQGTVAARLGSVVLGAGEKITLDFNGDGLINLQLNNASLGASVSNQGLLQANGGTVLMTAHAGNALMADVVNNSGVIEATSLQQRNGVVVLDGGDSGVVANSGRIDVSGRDAGQTGGTVKLLGEYVGMFDGSRIDASGAAGGGTVLAGGDYQGGNGLFQASATYMDANASIQADALKEGNGGRVILWATDATRFYGNISATGAGTGTNSGSGGLVETSAHYLEALGTVNLAAASGQGGTWLLDPTSINITSGANTNISGSSPFTATGSGATSVLSSATLNASLSEGANVIVQTGTGSSGTGDITVSDNIRAVGNASLTLQSYRNITVSNSSISNASGKTLNVTLTASTGGTGNITLSNASIATNGGNIAMTATASGANATSLANTTLDAGGGNISIRANVSSGTGEAFVLSGGDKILTNGTGAITIDSSALGSGNATRIFNTNNSIVAAGSGNLTIRGNATSGYGVLVCSTAAASSQNISVGSGTLTISANSNGFAGAGRGVYLASSGNGTVSINASAGGNIVIGGNSTGSYGTIFNATAAGSAINVLTDGNITISGNTSGSATTPALALVASGNGTSSAAPGSAITIRSSSGNVAVVANNTVVNTSSGAFRALSIDVGGQYANVTIASNSGQLRLDGTSTSGRGVDIAPSGANAVVRLATTTGDILISGNSTSSYGGYGIFFNSTGSAVGVNVSTTTGNITLNGDSVGTSDAIALGGSGTVAANRITSQGGNIVLNGNFHSPNSGELDHGIAILAVTNVMSTTGSGNLTLTGNAADQGNGVALYSNGRATLSVENGQLRINGSSNWGDGIGLQTGVNLIRATGTGSVALTGTSAYGSGISIYPSGNASAATIASNSGSISLTGTSGAGSSAAGILMRSAASAAANGVAIVSASGNISLTGTGLGSGEGISLVGTASNGYSTIATGAAGNITITATSNGAYGLRFTGGNNSLQVNDGVLAITARADNGTPIGQSGDTTTIAAIGRGVVVRNLGGLTSNILTDTRTAPASISVQASQPNNAWVPPSPNTQRLGPLGPQVDRASIDLALLDTAAPAATPSSTESQDHEPQ